MDFEDIKKIVDKEGKVIILEDKKAYVVSRYAIKAPTPDPTRQVEEKGGSKIRRFTILKKEHLLFFCLFFAFSLS